MGAQTFPSRPDPKGTVPHPTRKSTKAKKPWYTNVLRAAAALKRARRLAKAISNAV